MIFLAPQMLRGMTALVVVLFSLTPYAVAHSSQHCPGQAPWRCFVQGNMPPETTTYRATVALPTAEAPAPIVVRLILGPCHDKPPEWFRCTWTYARRFVFIALEEVKAVILATSKKPACFLVHQIGPQPLSEVIEEPPLSKEEIMILTWLSQQDMPDHLTLYCNGDHNPQIFFYSDVGKELRSIIRHNAHTSSQ